VAITLSELRANIYQLVDKVLETGVPLEITRGEARVQIVAVERPSKLRQLPLRPLFSCDPNELIGATDASGVSSEGESP
jgi:antitoxin (DNA-binding transcriptional repressor) of toxin-antitoxin stability system